MKRGRLSLFKGKGERELERIYFEMTVDLENNYKDRAQEARVLLGKRAEELYSGNFIGKRCYEKYRRIYMEYTEKMKGYRH